MKAVYRSQDTRDCINQRISKEDKVGHEAEGEIYYITSIQQQKSKILKDQ